MLINKDIWTSFVGEMGSYCNEQRCDDSCLMHENGKCLLALVEEAIDDINWEYDLEEETGW